MLLEGEALDYVPGTDYAIIQNRGRFSYGIDAILLSEFTRPKGKLVDLGTGTGIIPIRLRGRKNFTKAYALEIQEEVYQMAKRSVAYNKIDNIEIINMDLRQVEEVFTKHSIDTVVSNPPYMKNDGLVNRDENFAISRHEILCSIEDIARVSSYLLRPHGRLFLVHRPDRLVDILYNLRINQLEPKRMRLVQPSRDKEPNLLLIEAVKSGKSEIRIEKPLIVYNEDGQYTEEIKKIYYRSC